MSIPAKRKFAAMTGDGRVVIDEGDIPSVGCGEVLVEVHASLISPGTEMGTLLARRRSPKPCGEIQPFGYSNAGVVIAKGAMCDEFEIGMRVACMGSGYALHATHALVPKNLCVPIPDGVSYEEASFVHLAATALQAIRRAELQIGEYVAVVGLGIIGQVACQLAKLSGAFVIAFDKLNMRLNLAKELGADEVVNLLQQDPIDVSFKFTDGFGIDCGIIAFGGDATDAFDMLLRMMKVAPDTHRMGRIVVVGGCNARLNFPVPFGNMDIRASSRTGPGYHDEAWERGDNYPSVFVRWDTRTNMRLILRLILEGKLNVRRLITHEFPLSEAAMACDLLIENPDAALGVILKPMVSNW
ncbi:MAG: zinc-binding alcohol dehydrogenase [Armatimonadota bacterium]|nr:zinc-binding alcohol dehydrogenase [Armatimonadota bacterium]MCX7777028.1 zinc-binding alcohol dehydrogenase [Armatimonadota bacterium]MDW8024904.1 zinc-binding alcohol dehydrogenase [Armatimonadota bacterium]